MLELLMRKLRELTGEERWKVLNRLRKPAWLGTLRRTTPLSAKYGFDRGTPVDRYYIEQFLDEHRKDIAGRVLEVKDSGYTQRFGTNVEEADVLDVDRSNRGATIIADLAAADCIAPDSFDCFILTQTLQYIYDTRAAIAHSYRIMRRDGVLLVTVPAMSRITGRDAVDFWRFTASSCEKLFGDVFGVENITVRSYGNVLTGVAFWVGMAHEELSKRELEVHDSKFPLVIAVRAKKAGADRREERPAAPSARTEGEVRRYGQASHSMHVYDSDAAAV